ncbi:hypothetical protein M404DRAFT_32851 [Pisolithus tinctorius Marx 270]|uniref:Retrotransposon gag domain-containing protein n=1 Tax=Pisolithus tinctorius Marx 270 TaxID=870435 RepID=A0A0C3NMR0_PISTI|nr:hypothetical protein M404DRAFT_32851 [Pisolithus tinctorius Marx 270]
MLSLEEEDNHQSDTLFRSVLKEEQEANQTNVMSMTVGHGESILEMPSWQYTKGEVEWKLEEQRVQMAEEVCQAMHTTTSDPFPQDWYARNFGKAVPPEPPVGGGSKGKAWYNDDEDYQPVQPPNSGQEFNVRCPEEYDGSHNGLQTWVTQVEGYLNLNQHVYNMEVLKISFTLTYMTKGAVVSFMENYQNENKLLNGSIYYTDTFQKFVNHLRAMFESGDQTVLTILHLSDIKQGTHKLEAYIAEFTGLVNKAQLKEESQEAGTFFRKVLNKEYHNWILNSG